MSKRNERHGPSKTRIVHYEVHGPWKDNQDPEPLLKKAVADGIITQYDDGRGAMCWFEGPPGKPMRELRDTIRGMSNHDLVTDCDICKMYDGYPYYYTKQPKSYK